jgi:transmembrane sensor
LALAAVLCAALFIGFTRPSPSAELRMQNGDEVPSLLTARGRRAVTLDDGSAIDLGEGARVDVLESTGRAFGLALRGGEVEFEVHPGGPRTWRIECGGLTVEVVGTHFTVTRTTDAVRVAVTRGAVLVRGERVPDAVVRLGPGQSIVVPWREESRVNPETTAPPAVAGSAVTEGPARGLAARVDPAREDAPSPSNAADPTPRAAVTALAETKGLDTLLARADDARRSGQFVEAARLLEEGIARYPGEPRVAITEFSLGRLYMDSLGDAARAAAHFSHATADGRLPATLREDAAARLVEARSRAGDSAGAVSAAARYRALYPAGRRSADVDRWISSAR